MSNSSSLLPAANLEMAGRPGIESGIAAVPASMRESVAEEK
jgi:hypothetical protein